VLAPNLSNGPLPECKFLRQVATVPSPTHRFEVAVLRRSGRGADVSGTAGLACRHLRRPAQVVGFCPGFADGGRGFTRDTPDRRTSRWRGCLGRPAVMASRASSGAEFAAAHALVAPTANGRPDSRPIVSLLLGLARLTQSPSAQLIGSLNFDSRSIVVGSGECPSRQRADA
jgi:hypothetical protein